MDRREQMRLHPPLPPEYVASKDETRRGVLIIEPEEDSVATKKVREEKAPEPPTRMVMCSYCGADVPTSSGLAPGPHECARELQDGPCPGAGSPGVPR